METRNTVNIGQSNKFIDRKFEMNKEKLDLDKQKLRYESEILNYDKYLTGCSRNAPDTDEFRTEMQIFIKTIYDGILTFTIQHANKIRDVKMKIQKKTKLSADQQNLFFQGEILDDDNKTVDEYQICEKSVVGIISKLRGGLRIYVETFDGKTFSIEVSTDEIIDVKKKIQEITGWHPKYQILIYKGDILQSYQLKIAFNTSFVGKLSGLSIYTKMWGLEGTSIDVFAMNIFVALKSTEMHVFVRQIDGKIISLAIKISDKILDIKKKIHETIKLPGDDVILIYQGEILDDNYKCIVKMKYNWNEILEDNKTICQYLIVEKSVINIVARAKNEIQILIKTSNKSIIPINIPETSKIIDVKSMISEKTGMQFDKNYFIYENEILDDEKLLIDYRIGDGCVISIDVDSKLSLFMQAIKSGSLKTVKELYDSRFHKMEHEPFSPNPLHYACKLNNTDIVKFLIEKHFGVNCYDRKLNNPIHYACINNCEEILKTLTKYAVNLEACDSRGMKPIHLACLNGNIENVKLLIGHHCDLDSMDDLERRPLHLACLAGNIDIVKLLIQNNCKIDVLDKSNKSPFNIAEKENFVDIMIMINEEVSKRMIENMIKELDLKCLKKCDHKFCPISLRDKTFNKGVKIKHRGPGKVYQCKFSQSSSQIAIKQISKDKIDSKNIEGNINRFIEKVKHERIIKYFGTLSKEENVFVFMEFMSNGSLRSQISINPPMISSKVIHYTIQILEGLQFLHSNKIIHRDIKPDNILLDNDGNVKLTDFGLGLLLWTTDGQTAQANTFCGTIDYMAPEIINSETYSYGADIWSLGVSVIEMATGMRPFQALPPPKIMYKIATTKTIPYELPASSPSKMKEFIDQMLILEPSRRPIAMDLINKLKEI